MFLGHAAFRKRRVAGEPHGDAPAAFGVALNVPVRLDDDGLMDQLKAAFALADGFDRVTSTGPPAG